MSAMSQYSIYGIGAGSDDLHYIGWTDMPLADHKEQIVSDLRERGSDGVARWVSQAVSGGGVDIFEIESAPSPQDANDSVMFWCEYYRWLGMDVVTDHRPGA
jgi:hypothetical protein